MIHDGAYQASWPAAVERVVRDNEADRQGQLWAERMRKRANALPDYVVSSPNFWLNFQRYLYEFNRRVEDDELPWVTAENVDKEFMEFLNKKLLVDADVLAAVRRERKRPKTWPKSPKPPRHPKKLVDLLAETIQIGREVLAAI